MRDLVASRRLVAALGVSGREASPSPQRRSVHAVQNHWTWWKLHRAVDPDSDEILASEATTTEEGDALLVGPSLERINRPISAMFADGAYDGEPVYRSRYRAYSRQGESHGKRATMTSAAIRAPTLGRIARMAVSGATLMLSR
jgi:hypothetical protein